MIHSVNCTEESFETLLDGTKAFEARKNDRFYQVGDFLAVNEVVTTRSVETLTGQTQPERYFTGRCLLFEITFILQDRHFLVDNYVILGIKRVNLGEVPDRVGFSERSVALKSYGVNEEET